MKRSFPGAANVFRAFAEGEEKNHNRSLRAEQTVKQWGAGPSTAAWSWGDF